MPEIANRFDPKKNYMNLRFHHGRVLQDSEMNELMSLFWHQISTFAGTVLADGVCTNPPTHAQGGGWNCPDSFVVIRGQFVFVPAKDLPTGVAVGVKYRKKILTAKEDRDLEDQTEGSVNEGQPGGRQGNYRSRVGRYQKGGKRGRGELSVYLYPYER